MQNMRLLTVIVGAALLAATLGGCTGLRFVVDAVPATDELEETVVLSDDHSSRGAKVAMIELTGLIADARKPGLILPGENPVARFVEELRMAGDDPDVAAVIIRINSPGGTVTASDTLYREVERFRERTGKPVVMLMADVAASGGYYVACAGDAIIANPTTTTGSVGVIIQTFNFSEGMSKIGIRADAITSGPNKAIASPFEEPVAAHRAILQDMVNEYYARFRELVQTRRPKVADSDLDWVTDGRVVSGARAAEVGMVDATGDLYDAFDRAKQLAQIESGRLVRYHRSTEHVGSAYAQAPIAMAGSGGREINLLQINLGNGGGAGGGLDYPPAGFYYLWDPSVEW